MSDELNALQETATQARAKADELKNALTDNISKKERAAALDAEADAVEAEAAYADAKAEADAAAQGGDAQPKVGDPCTNADDVAGTWQQDGDGMVCVVEPPAPKAGNACTLPDNTEGHLVEQDGSLVCVSKEPPPPEPPKEGMADDAPDPEASRTGFAAPGLKAGDACVCPDGRPGTVQSFTVGLICLPNQG